MVEVSNYDQYLIGIGGAGTKSGPGPAQIRRISGFVKSKIDGENAVVWSKDDVISKKKKVFRLHMLIFQCHFDGPPLELMGTLLGLLKPEAFLKSIVHFESLQNCRPRRNWLVGASIVDVSRPFLLHRPRLFNFY